MELEVVSRILSVELSLENVSCHSYAKKKKNNNTLTYLVVLSLSASR